MKKEQKMDFLFGIFTSVFSGIGLKTMFSRWLATVAAGSLTEICLKPGYCFNEDGTLRPWAVLNSSPGCTFLHVGIIPAVLGLLPALFV